MIISHRIKYITYQRIWMSYKYSPLFSTFFSLVLFYMYNIDKFQQLIFSMYISMCHLKRNWGNNQVNNSSTICFLFILCHAQDKTVRLFSYNPTHFIFSPSLPLSLSLSLFPFFFREEVLYVSLLPIPHTFLPLNILPSSPSPPFPSTLFPLPCLFFICLFTTIFFFNNSIKKLWYYRGGS